jgi:AcrR family transcriptional regulator
VQVVPLARKLGLSRTSFYWFYRNREALLKALIAGWRAKNTGNLISQCDRYAESITEAILNVFDCWLDADLFDSKLEFAVRSWAQQSAAVSREIRSADKLRLDALQRMLVRFGYDAAAADVRSRTVYLTQIGYISVNAREDLDTRMRRSAHYVEIFTGKRPRAPEINRFFSRHGFKGEA